MEHHPPKPAKRHVKAKSEEGNKAQKFMDLHSKAYELTTSAIKLDEDRKLDQAYDAYQESLVVIDKAVELAHSGGFPEDKVDKITDLLYKMRMTRKEILERASDISLPRHPAAPEYLQGPSNFPAQGSQQNTNSHMLPEYSEESRSGSTAASTVNMYSVLNESLDAVAREEGACQNPLPLNAQEVFSIPENVQIYFISKDDSVSAPSYPSFLRVVVINQDEPRARSQPPAFLQVGDWNYPLWHGQSPIYEASDGSYIFPDVVTPNGDFVGLILPENLEIEQKRALEDILFQLIGQTAFLAKGAAKVPEPEVLVDEPTVTTEKYGAQISAAAEKLAQGIVYGAGKTSEYMEKGASYLVTKIDPAQDKASIRPELRSGMKTARLVTGKAVKVTAYVINQLSKGTMKLGHHVAPYIHKTATRMYASSTNRDETEAGGKIDQVLEVTGGAVVAFGTVFVSLEHAATVLAKSIRNNTVTVVEHRYGPEAGSFCEDTTSTIGNSVLTGYNVKGLAPKALARRIAKDTGIGVISNPDKGQRSTKPPSGP